jgi:hypothetical protein
MILLRIFLQENQWYAEWLAGCDVYREPISFATAMMLEAWL